MPAALTWPMQVQHVVLDAVRAQEASPSPAADPTSLDFDGWAVALVLVVTVLVLGTGALIIRARRVYTEHSISESFIRSWMAGVLVVGLLVFCAVLLFTPYTDLRNLVFGGLIAAVAGAVSYYFASKEADQARQEQISAVFGTTQVPNLICLTVKDAKAALGSSSLRIVISPPGAPEDHVVSEQSPSPGLDVKPWATAVQVIAVPSADAAGCAEPPAPEMPEPAPETAPERQEPALEESEPTEPSHAPPQPPGNPPPAEPGR